ncbi:Shikimate dehydrogenase (NADP(+)) [Ferriphaselus amnicola]|uniref:Shikimate dehydrogenase (NADP(+)) n=1 Tax=Ferriphaselus amnicola TaxID=1188319 RepID=A0A2Z6GC67_9PROT|nr:shikimate dehydrogenase [Ferriphaselus amnicola]BBE51086.1 Shikimate dehydrogenase (NADP(+)) [Ferriphaselus amnicola]
MTDRYAVIGHPISHSKSPLIHKMFAEQTGQDISYEAIEAPLDGFAATIERLRAEGYKGCNVTVPFKFEAYRLVSSQQRARIEAELAKAVNTLSFLDDSQIFGDNTDGIGLVQDIQQNLKVVLSGKRVLLMGAGGAAYGVALPLLNAEAKLVVANRTEDKAFELASRFNADRITGCGYEALSGQQFDVVINATSSGLSDELPPLPPGIFAPGALAYDMMYGRETPFMRFAREQGAAQVADGLGMLVEQAAEAFYIWCGVRPDTVPVLAALRG